MSQCSGTVNDSEMEEISAADDLDTSGPASPIFPGESSTLSLSPSKLVCPMDLGFPPAISRAFGGNRQNFLGASLFSHSLGLFVSHYPKQRPSDLTTKH